MNKIRRKELHVLVNKLNAVRFDKTIDSNKLSTFYDYIQDIKEELEDILADEEYYMDNIPENLQNSRRYDTAEQACGSIEDAIEYLENMIECNDINEILALLNKAIASIMESTN